jgi:DnaJ-class molecular chaperone
VSSALVFGFKGEKEVCSSCNGTGGVVCFACDGTGVMTGEIPVEIENRARQQSIGRNKNKRECIACKGVGRLLCKSCGGSGYK